MPQGSPAVLKFFSGVPCWVRKDNFKGQIPSQCLHIRIDVWAISHSRCISHTTAIRAGNR